MSQHRSSFPRAARAAAAILIACSVPRVTDAQSAPVLFRHVRVFDGTRATGPRDVLVDAGIIRRIGESIAAPPGAQVIDGAGKTLLPGLIDSHTHAWPGSLETAIAFGVTTEMDMFTDVKFAASMRAQQAAGAATARADLFSAGTLATAPHGHGTEYGVAIPTISAPAEAQAFVDARIAEGSDYIKIIYDDGHTYGLDVPTISKETMAALIRAAHARKKLAIVHIGSYAGARDAIDAGADGLAHLFVDRAPDRGFAALVAARHAFVVPTLSVLAAIAGVPAGAQLANDARLAPYLSPADTGMLNRKFTLQPGAPPRSFAAAEATVRALEARGVTLLAGTDAGNPGTAHGASLLGELALLVDAGLTPTEALVSATSAPARVFGLADRGRIAEGLRADLVLVNGDPTTDITATRAIAGVWKQGVHFDREAVARQVAAAEAAARTPAAVAGSGTVSTFDDGTTSSAFGAGWMISTDAMANGKSAATMDVVEGGAAGTPKSLEIGGTISPAISYAWAGAMFSPGAQPMSPVNLSAKTAIHFWAKGDGGTYRVMLFAQSKGFAPMMRTFVAGPDWHEYDIPFSAFGPIDGHDIMAVIFSGGPTPGAFKFRIDEVSFR